MRPEKIKHTKLISPEDAANTLNDEYELNSALLNQLKVSIFLNLMALKINIMSRG